MWLSLVSIDATRSAFSLPDRTNRVRNARRSAESPPPRRSKILPKAAHSVLGHVTWDAGAARGTLSKANCAPAAQAPRPT